MDVSPKLCTLGGGGEEGAWSYFANARRLLIPEVVYRIIFATSSIQIQLVSSVEI